MAYLVLIRHGQSEWNKKNVFTGWVDIPLSKQGIQEALSAGSKIKIPIDIIFTSTLVRSLMTALLAMSEHNSGKVPVLMHQEGKLCEWGKIQSQEAVDTLIPVYRSDALNERMYGDLQGLNKKQTMEQFGEDQVKIWRRSYDVPPPHGESLAMTAQRAIPYFQEYVIPHLKKDQNVLIAAHGNSLRAIVQFLDGLNNEQVVGLELETGSPLFYEWQGMQLIKKNECGS